MAIQTPTVPSGGTPMPRGAPNIGPLTPGALLAYPPAPGTAPGTMTAAGGFLPTYGTTNDTLAGQTTKAAPDAMPGGTGKNATYPTPPGDGTSIPTGFMLQNGQQQYNAIGPVALASGGSWTPVAPLMAEPQEGGENPPPAAPPPA